MKKVIHINSSNSGSTGSIMLGICDLANKNGYNAFPAYPSSRENFKKKVPKGIFISNRFERNIHLKLAYVTGMNGCFSKKGTNRFIKILSDLNPDIIHIHNLHNCYINLEILFKYIKTKNIAVVWTLHDCWSFTGKCPYFTIANCYKWKTGCFDCPQFRSYPPARIDKSKIMYELKKNWFLGVNNLTLVTPSEWLKTQVQDSLLKTYPITVINNGIDLTIFKPTQSGFREKYKLENQIILLGVANPWSDRKGLHLIKELASMLEVKYRIVLIGLNEEQLNELPDNILGLPRTNSPIELAEIYSAADYFLNPSLEETMGLVTVEAIACGTPAIVSNSTAVPEMVSDKCGVIVGENSSKGFYNTLINLDKKFELKDLLNHANRFRKEEKYYEYINLYNEILKN
jgi:glycosyltransferase involved in cell wall biosynthesis